MTPARQWLRRLVEPRLTNKGEPFRVFNRFDRKVYVQIWPMEMVVIRHLNVEKLTDRSLLEPWELLVRHEQLALVDEQPESAARYVRDLNG